MKIRFIRNVLVDVEKTRLQEVWDKHFTRWDELKIESITYYGKTASFLTNDGDYVANVPIDSFEVINQ